MSAADATPFRDHLTGFVAELRSRGMAVAPSALIDAARAVEILDLLDRASLREGLAATLLDEQNHRPAFDAVFDLWFPAGRGRRSGAGLPHNDSGEVDTAAARTLLARALAEDTSDGHQQVRSLVAAIVEEMGRYESTKGEAFSSYQAISRIDPQTLIAAIAAAMAAADAPADPAAGSDPRYRSAARDRATAVRAMIETETARRMASLRGKEYVGAHAVPVLPENIAFLAAGAQQQAELRRTVAPLAQLLAARLQARRRQARRGAVDIRRTLRASMSTGGVPISLVHRPPRPGKPELTILCDVSGSVAGFSEFTLHLAQALRQEFSRVRVFAFVDTVDEVTDFFDRGGADRDFAQAMAQMLTQARLITRGGHSDYGRVLRMFTDTYAGELTHRGALLILGDARTNYADPHTAALAQLVNRVRHAYWLNPEARAIWDTGDSAASAYGEVIGMHECRTVAQLSRVIAGLLPV